jgi:predicted amidophosphoribosyltransferase
VDDVVTTGSTVRECIETLRAAGHQVTAIVAVCCAPEAD